MALLLFFLSFCGFRSREQCGLGRAIIKRLIDRGLTHVRFGAGHGNGHLARLQDGGNVEIGQMSVSLLIEDDVLRFHVPKGSSSASAIAVNY